MEKYKIKLLGRLTWERSYKSIEILPALKYQLTKSDVRCDIHVVRFNFLVFQVKLQVTRNRYEMIMRITATDYSKARYLFQERLKESGYTADWETIGIDKGFAGGRTWKMKVYKDKWHK